MFAVKDLDWTFELTFQGEETENTFRKKYVQGNYSLKLNGCKVEKLEPANFKKEIPPLSKSNVLEIDNDAYKSV